MSHEPAGPPGSGEPSDRRSDEDPGTLTRIDAGTADRGWEYDDYPVADDEAAVEPPPGPAGWHFLTAAVRRRAVAVCLSGVVGLFLGAGLLTVKPPTYKATVQVILTQNPGQDALDAMETQVALAQTHAVAGAVEKELGLTQSIPAFLGSYTVTPITGRVLMITASAHSSAMAVRTAGAVATQYLKFRSAQIDSQNQAVLNSLDQQLTAERAQEATTTSQIAALTGQPKTAARTAQLDTLQALKRREQTAVTGLQQSTTANQVANQVSKSQQVSGSGILDPATAIPRSHLRTPAEYVGGGLIAGLVVGAGFVMIGALVSDRLRRRDDVSRALGAAVGVSVGRVRAGGRLWRPGMRLVSSRAVTQAGAYLSGLVAEPGADPSGLAVVPVGGDRAAAAVIVAAALARARDGAQVIVADLCPGAPAARMLGVRGAGVQMASGQDGQLAIVVPEPGEIAPAGPAVRPGPGVRLVLAREVYQAADVLLALVPLDPSSGSAHLASWAGRAVAVVTAGEASATRINAVGELIRLAGVTQLPAVLLGADKNDESIGFTTETASEDSGPGLHAVEGV
jgi:capsular polysaccharide biosynthesis protein